MVHKTSQGFPNGINWCGDRLGIMAKNCMKITNSVFWGQNSGGPKGGQANFSGSGGIPPSPPSPMKLGKTLLYIMHGMKKFDSLFKNIKLDNVFRKHCRLHVFEIFEVSRYLLKTLRSNMRD